jgi:hypothetical protein
MSEVLVADYLLRPKKVMAGGILRYFDYIPWQG